MTDLLTNPNPLTDSVVETPASIEETIPVTEQLRANLFDVKLRARNDGEREIVLHVPANYFGSLLNCAHFVGQGATVEITLSVGDEPISFDARLFDIKLRPRRDGGEREAVLRAPARYRSALYTLAAHIGNGVNVSLVFKQLPLAGTEGTDTTKGNGRRGRRGG